MSPNGNETELSELEIARLLEAARDVRLRAYAPYSKYQVGAAVLSADGQVCGGCNIENASYPLTICAERVAVGATIASGAGKPRAIAVVTENGASPCGACRQVLVEINPQMQVILAAVSGDTYRVTTAADLLPDRFEFDGSLTR